MGFGGPPDRDENKTVLSQIAATKGSKFRYGYDFGDSWEHEITVEGILPPNSGSAEAAVCVAGARACPPEDCGGIWGYAELLEALENPKHPEHKSRKEWMGREFDAELFDPAN